MLAQVSAQARKSEMRVTIREGASTCSLRCLVPKTMKRRIWGSRNLKHWPIGPLGVEPGTRAAGPEAFGPSSRLLLEDDLQVEQATDNQILSKYSSVETVA